MWKTPNRFWAQIGPFEHILASTRGEIHCTAEDLALFRKPYVIALDLISGACASFTDATDHRFDAEIVLKLEF